VRQIFPGEHRVTVGSGQPDTDVAGQSATFQTTSEQVRMPE
jgi:hypothetical protein